MNGGWGRKVLWIFGGARCGETEVRRLTCAAGGRPYFVANSIRRLRVICVESGHAISARRIAFGQGVPRTVQGLRHGKSAAEHCVSGTRKRIFSLLRPVSCLPMRTSRTRPPLSRGVEMVEWGCSIAAFSTPRVAAASCSLSTPPPTQLPAWPRETHRIRPEDCTGWGGNAKGGIP